MDDERKLAHLSNLHTTLSNYMIPSRRMPLYTYKRGTRRDTLRNAWTLRNSKERSAILVRSKWELARRQRTLLLSSCRPPGSCRLDTQESKRPEGTGRARTFPRGNLRVRLLFFWRASFNDALLFSPSCCSLSCVSLLRFASSRRASCRHAVSV